MSSWNNICRVCTSPAEYELFEKIPAYLHASSNDFLHWQKPINVLLEETTGLKCAENDGLPKKICALCISYLKHAVFFREQCINNSLSLKAIDVLRQKRQKSNQNVDKDSVLITAQQLSFTNEHQVDTNLLNNACSQDQDKVCKQLLNNTVQTATPSPQNVEQQMRYLNLLFNKDTNAGLHTYKRRNDGIKSGLENVEGRGDDPYAEEDFDSDSSSDENEAGAMQQNEDIFSYSETNFQEDDIMNLDELGNAITINIPESCKERKCRACFRRFMFEDSHNEHMSTCIEYKFLTYIEELNKLLYIRRNKAVSPHEFVRRMIFAIRKTCEWLKQANCGDMLLPDLVQNGNGAEDKTRKPLEIDYKSSAVTSGEQKRSNVQDFANGTLRKPFELPKQEKMTDLPNTSHSNSLEKTTKITESSIDNSLGNTQKALRSATPTPITKSNNILYEIERSQSRGSSVFPNIDLETKTVAKRPIAVITAEKNTTNTTAKGSKPINSAASNGSGGDVPRDTAERLTFLQKLHQAANQTPTSANSKHTTPATPMISVRKDLTSTTLFAGSDQNTTSPPTTTPKTIPITPLHRNLSFSARCNPCNILFETLAALEVHNAMFHNHMPVLFTRTTATTQQDDAEREAERRRIIALFEDDDDNDEELEAGGV